MVQLFLILRAPKLVRLRRSGFGLSQDHHDNTESSMAALSTMTINHKYSSENDRTKSTKTDGSIMILRPILSVKKKRKRALLPHLMFRN